MEPLAIAVVGCGRVAQLRHLPVLSSMAEASVVAIVDANPDRLESIGNQFSINARYPSVDDLLADARIDVVAVCVPASNHVAVSLAALDAGKHVFIEKPLALSLQDCDELIAAAEHSACRTMVGFNMRWHRLVAATRDAISAGALGPPELLRTVHTGFHDQVPAWRMRREDGGGVLFEQAIHHFDLWRYLLASEVQEVFARTRSGEWDDEAAVVSARMSNGALVSSAFSERTAAGSEIEVYGVRGGLRVRYYEFDGLEIQPAHVVPGSPVARLRRTAATLKNLPQAIGRLRGVGDHQASFREEWRHFITAIQQERRTHSTLQDGRQALQITLAAVRSAATGRPESPTEVS